MRLRRDPITVALDTKNDAYSVTIRIRSLITKYGVATVGDLFETVGQQSNHEDAKWGWTDTERWDLTPEDGKWLLVTTTPKSLREDEPVEQPAYARPKASRSRFVQIGTVRVNPDMVESLSTNTAGGRTTVVLQMFSGNKITAPSSLSMDDIEKKLAGE